MQTQPRPQGFPFKKWEKAFSRPTHFLREKPWGRGWMHILFTYQCSWARSSNFKKIDCSQSPIFFRAAIFVLYVPRGLALEFVPVPRS